MAFKIVGVEENSDFPPRVETRLAEKFASPADVDSATDSANQYADNVASSALANANSYTDDATDGLYNDIKDVEVYVSDAKLAGPVRDDHFTKLWNGISNVSRDTRVIVLGSSTANGGSGPYVTKPEKACFWRLAYRCGVTQYPTLASVANPVGAGGMRWWNGAQGNTTSVDYFPEARRQQLNNVKPDYVFHMIGSNDYFYGTTIAAFKANMLAHCEYIEGASPGVVNVLIHQPDRLDVTNPVAPWSAYGEALREVAENSPTNRVFMDSMEFFAQLGSGTDDRGGIMFDDVHINDEGHRYLADFIGARAGIPSESQYHPVSTIVDIPFPATQAWTGSASQLARGGIQRAKFPRIARVSGSIWVTNPGTGNASIRVYFVNSNGDETDVLSHRILPGGASSVPINSHHYIPPSQFGSIRVLINTAGASITVQGEPTLTNLQIELRAV